MSDMGLTAMQLEALTFITNYIEGNGIPPTVREINDGLGLHSKSGVHRLLVALEERGKIHRMRKRARAIGLGMPTAHRCPNCNFILDGAA
jgi:repressor LexA